LLVTSVSLALLVEAVESVAASITGGDCTMASVRDLGRFLTRIAVQTLSRPDSLGLELQSRVFDRGTSENDLGLVGVSGVMSDLRQDLLDVGQGHGSVLLVGESGTGKEVVARALHDMADPDRPFIAVNCAALPRELCESELFGHERGAFTGSREGSKGLLRAAENGTLFLDEITEMPEELQPKLLRALEQRTVRPVGGVREYSVNARVIAATNRDPGSALQSGQLRADLFFRVCVHHISVPPLRARLEDIPALASHFLRQLSSNGHRVSPSISDATLNILRQHDFPGNVRELRKLLEHGVAVARGAPIEPQHLPRHFRPKRAASLHSVRPVSSPNTGAAGQSTQSRVVPLDEAERSLIAHALQEAQGNKALAARLLGVSRHQLYSKLERLGISPSSARR
jgi:DNA-binding NtrC family response regulator